MSVDKLRDELRLQLVEALLQRQLYAFNDMFWRAVGDTADSMFVICPFSTVQITPTTDKYNRVTGLRRQT